jgi:hypothetical protein
MESIEHLVANLNTDYWEEGVMEWARAQTQAAVALLIKRKDDELAKQHGPELTMVGFRKRRVIARFGDFTIQRRLYRDSQGKGRFLLDEVMGLEKRSLLSGGVKEMALFLASQLPFGKCEDVLWKMLPCGVSHTTIHREVGRVIDPCLAEEETAVTASLEHGRVIPAGQQRPERLHIEADGVSIALQREDARRVEVKVGIAYEGWEAASGRDRFQLKDKTVYMRLTDGERFWQGFSLKLGGRYDTSRIEHTILNGDGASWVREGSALLGGAYQLDRFHLRRALLRGLGGDVALANEIYRHCVQGDHAWADALLAGRQRDGDAEQGLQVGRLRAYLLDNIGGLADYRIALGGEALRGMGAIEGNNHKLLACRMKRRGMSWTRRGADRMARLLELLNDNRLKAWIGPKQNLQAEVPAVTPPPVRRKPRRPFTGQPEVTCNMPALYGPHQGRMWVRALNAIAHGEWNI